MAKSQERTFAADCVVHPGDKLTAYEGHTLTDHGYEREIEIKADTGIVVLDRENAIRFARWMLEVMEGE